MSGWKLKHLVSYCYKQQFWTYGGGSASYLPNTLSSLHRMQYKQVTRRSFVK